MLGETGILLVRHRLSPSAATLERLRELVAANVGAEERELLLGSPGTMLVARELGFDDLWQASAERLLEVRDPETGIWTQHIWDQTDSYLGAAHGFAGCVLALGDFEGAAEAARRYAIDRGRPGELAAAPRRRSATGRSGSSGATARRG